MYTLFLVCAVIGGITLLFQFTLMMLGFVDIDMPDELDADGLDAVEGFDVTNFDLDIDGSSHTTLSATFVLISFRTIVAAMTFFGLTGLLMLSLEAAPWLSMGMALAAGFGAMVLVAWVMQTLYGLRADGTARIKRAINHRASVYIPIPAEGEGKGKIQVNLQGRTMEYEAITAGRQIQSGDTVLITRIVSSDTVEVEPAFELEEGES